MRWFAIAVMFVLFVNLASDTQADPPKDWPQWRGPKGDGVSEEKGWNATFEESPKKLWDAKVGRGFSSPIIRDGFLYLFSTDNDTLQKESISCHDALTGKEQWKHTYEMKSVKRTGNPAGGTPAIVDGKVFSYGAGLNLVCVDAKTGKPIWANDLMADLPGQPVPYGYQLSPLPFENLIIVPAITNTDAKKSKPPFNEPRGGPYAPQGGVLLAFDQKTGKEIWRNSEGASAWSSPVLADLGGKKTVVHLTGRYLLGIDAKTGKTLWKSDLRDVGVVAEDMAASPVVVGDIVFTPIHKAYGNPSSGTACTAAFRVKDGEVKRLWKNDQWCHWFQSAAVWEKGIYGFDEKSTFWCIDLETGKEKWKSKEFGVSGKSGGGIMIADGKVIAIDARQQLTIAEVSLTKPKILSQARIFKAESGYECETAPLLFGGLLYCRNHTQLICFDLRPAKP